MLRIEPPIEPKSRPIRRVYSDQYGVSCIGEIRYRNEVSSYGFFPNSTFFSFGEVHLQEILEAIHTLNGEL